MIIIMQAKPSLMQNISELYYNINIRPKLHLIINNTLYNDTFRIINFDNS